MYIAFWDLPEEPAKRAVPNIFTLGKLKKKKNASTYTDDRTTLSSLNYETRNFIIYLFIYDFFF